MDGQLFARLSEVREAASRAYRRAPFVPAAKALNNATLPNARA